MIAKKTATLDRDRLAHTLTILHNALGSVIVNDETYPPEAYVTVTNIDEFTQIVVALRDLTAYKVKTEAVAGASHLRLWLEE